MAVFRVEKNRNYTTMANYHLRDMNLSLKAIGLLSKMLSLCDEWDYTTRGLASICKEGVDSIGSTLKELEVNGYLVRNRLRDKKGRIADTEYIIYEKPHTLHPDMSHPDTEKPYMDKPYTEKPTQLNTKALNNDRLNTQESNPNPSNHGARDVSPVIPSPPKQMGYELIGFDSLDELKEVVYVNIEYEHFKQYGPVGIRERLDEVADLIIETLCSTKETIHVAGDDYPTILVKEKLLKINSMHIEYVFDCLDKNTTYVRNIKQYLLAALFNAPSTIDSYYTALVNHDMHHTNN